MKVTSDGVLLLFLAESGTAQEMQKKGSKGNECGSACPTGFCSARR